jgi:hypothetical protein
LNNNNKKHSKRNQKELEAMHKMPFGKFKMKCGYCGRHDMKVV